MSKRQNKKLTSI